MTQLILIRGLPGSGKSTQADSMCRSNPNLLHFEADMFFEATGTYVFDPAQLKTAHDWCYSNATFNLLGGKSVIVSNTFTQLWEMERYIALALSVEADITIVEMRTQYKSVHNVPDEKIEQMRRRWEPLSDEILKCVTYIVRES